MSPVMTPSEEGTTSVTSDDAPHQSHVSYAGANADEDGLWRHQVALQDEERGDGHSEVTCCRGKSEGLTEPSVSTLKSMPYALIRSRYWTPSAYQWRANLHTNGR